MSDPVKVFVSYSHKDSQYLGDTSLLGFMRGLKKDGADFWYDTRLTAGEQWDDEIRTQLEQADIALILVSQSFLDSEYCTNVEVKDFVERSKAHGLTIVPVILSPCDWKRHDWLCSTQQLPGGGKNIEQDYEKDGDRKGLFHEIREALLTHIMRVREKKVVAVAPEPVRRAMVGEQRQITALACELTAGGGAKAIDPAELLRILPDYRSRATEIIRRLDGYVDPRRGKRILAYFGCPRVHEDDPQRAVIAARDLLELAKSLDDGKLGMKIAIHTGPMVLSEIADGAEPVLDGDVPDLVSEVLNATPANRIYLTAATHELIEKQFVCEAIDDVFALKGAEAEQPVSKHVFVARDQELNILRQCWDLASEGDGQVVLIRGEAGLGKSRLLQELRSSLSDAAMVWLECRCSPYHQNTELYPLIDLLQRVLANEKQYPQPTMPERLEALLRQREMPLETNVPLLSSLLSLPLPPGYAPVNLSPEAKKKSTLAAILDLILRLANKQPVLLVVEDLHWIDASTVGFLGQLIETQATAPLLTLLTFRPEFEAPWKQLSYLVEVSLRRLGSKEAGKLIARLTEGKSLPPDVVQELIEKADGIPLFAEELTKMVMESEAIAAGQTLAVPATLKGSLMARLDRLDTAKDIAQIASVIGREFYSALLSQAAPVDEATLARDLDRLLESEIILRRGLPSEGLYLFKHALIQQAAYDSILGSDARELHRRIAEGTEAKFPELVERQPEIVAFHFEHAGMPEKAIDYRERAAERSLKNSANAEAIAHLRKCLDLLEALPAGADRDRREMRVRTNLALPLMATKGYAANEVDETLRRAKELCAEVGDNEELFRVIRLHWTFQSVRGDHRNALEAARQIVAMAESEGAPHQQLEAHRVLGSSLFYMGQMEEAREHFARALALYDRERDRGHVLIYGLDPAVVCLSANAPTLWHLGRVDEARDSAAQAIALARESGHPYTICYSLLLATMVHVFDRNRELVQSTAAEVMEIAKYQSFAFWETMAILLDAWAKEQATTMRVAMTKLLGTGARLYAPMFLSMRAELHMAQGDRDAASAAVEEGLAISAATGEMLGVPKLEQQRAELLELVKQ